jgi:hypothetical protein
MLIWEPGIATHLSLSWKTETGVCICWLSGGESETHALGAVPFSVPGGGICDNGGMVVGLWQLSNCLFLNSRPGWTSGPGQTSQSLVSTYVSAHVLQMFGRSDVTVNLVVASHRYNALGVLYMCRCFARARRPSRKEGNFCFSGADLRAAVCICRDMSNYCLPSWREGF